MPKKLFKPFKITIFLAIFQWIWNFLIRGVPSLSPTFGTLAYLLLPIPLANLSLATLRIAHTSLVRDINLIHFRIAWRSMQGWGAGEFHIALNSVHFFILQQSHATAA